MGHVFAPKSQALSGRDAAQVFTASTPWELVTVATAKLHEVMTPYRRDRWAVLGLGGRSLATLRKTRLWHRPLWSGQAPGLSCVIRADWYNQGRSPTISTDFCQGRKQGGEQDQRLKTVTVRVGLYRERRGGLTLRKVAERLAALKPGKWSPEQCLRAIRVARTAEPIKKDKPPKGDRLWWVDPKETPEDVTRFVFLIYLWQADMINLDTSGEARQFAKRFIKTFIRRRERNDIENRGADDIVHTILDRMRQRYALPQHWRGLRQYLKRVARNVQEQAGRTRVAHLADELGVSVRTLYRWASHAGVNFPGNVESDRPKWDQIRQRAEAEIRPGVDRRKLRRQAMTILTGSRGKSPEAARKLIQRRLQAGESLESMVRRLRRGGRP